jgi:hypothetical protein
LVRKCRNRKFQSFTLRDIFGSIESSSDALVYGEGGKRNGGGEGRVRGLGKSGVTDRLRVGLLEIGGFFSKSDVQTANILGSYVESVTLQKVTNSYNCGENEGKPQISLASGIRDAFEKLS